MRVADYISKYIENLGINDVFMVTGGGAMFLNDGVAINKNINAICNHHEQASAMAAVGYSKYKNSCAVVYATTGCGSTNTITGLLDAWQDNLPCIFISGQVKRKDSIGYANLPLRQVGVQEANIIPIVSSLTKYAVTIDNPNDILYHLEKAVYLATHGRPGPVWIDVPMDIQGSMIDEMNLKNFDQDEIIKDYKEEPFAEELRFIENLLMNAKRPIIIAGNGIRLSSSINNFKSFIEKYNIPFVTSYLAIDLLPSNHKLNIGRIGIKGDRAGNFALQNSDLVIALGTRLPVAMTGYDPGQFAREAKVIAVDIDPYEHKKSSSRIDFIINASLEKFFALIKNIEIQDMKSWIETCNRWKTNWPICLPGYEEDQNGINMYYFIDKLSKNLKFDSVVVSDAGSAFYVTSQALKLKDNQRYITSGGQAEMGFTIPACIGVSVARKNKEVIGITGDGSFQMNLQELQTIVYNKLPIKIFVWNNNGYLSIRTTQIKFFDNRFIGTDEKSGLSFPSLKKIAKAFGIKYYYVDKSKKLDSIIEKVLNHPNAVICEVICPQNQEVVPAVSSQRMPDGRMISKPLEDMYPFLDRKEFYKEMIVKPLDE